MKIVQTLKDNNQDFEFYPTTNEILDLVCKDIDISSDESILDIGAGNGKPLIRFKKEFNCSCYAIEKSEILVGQLPNDIFIVGTDFLEQSLIDKPMSVIFCNPPYKQFETWMNKVIREAYADNLYFVVPSRWKNNSKIIENIKDRDAKYEILGDFDFISSEDRQARAKVDLVKIDLTMGRGYGRKDPFHMFFDESFGELSQKFKEKEEKKEECQPKFDIVRGGDIIKSLVDLYNDEMMRIYDSYKAIALVDVNIISELGASLKSIKECLKNKIKNTKNEYWNELFNNLDKITDRLTKKSRKKMLSRIIQHTNVDFTYSNILSIVIWAIKNANQYYDDQLVEVFEDMVSKANCKLYKSNKKTFTDEQWRYCRCEEERIDKVKLEYRIVLSNQGGIWVDDWRTWNQFDWGGLSERAHDFIQDLITVANNLDFVTNTPIFENKRNKDGIIPCWTSGKYRNF